MYNNPKCKQKCRYVLIKNYRRFICVCKLFCDEEKNHKLSSNFIDALGSSRNSGYSKEAGREGISNKQKNCLLLYENLPIPV